MLNRIPLFLPPPLSPIPLLHHSSLNGSSFFSISSVPVFRLSQELAEHQDPDAGGAAVLNGNTLEAGSPPPW